MKIISKRGRAAKSGVEVRELEVTRSSGGSVIIVNGANGMSQEEIDRAVDAIRELHDQLRELDDVISDGWYGQQP